MARWHSGNKLPTSTELLSTRLTQEEVDKLYRVQEYYGLPTKTDTIRCLILTKYAQLEEQELNNASHG